MRLPLRIGLEIGAMAAGCIFGAHASNLGGDLAFKVLRLSETSDIWLRPYVAPAFNFKQLAGPKPEGAVEGCKVANVDTRYSDHADRRLVLECAQGIRLQLQHVDFEN